MGDWDVFFGGGERAKKRTLGIRDKQILHERAHKRCENCGRRLEFSEMQVGHKTAHAKGGSAQLRNLLCLCYKCNKLQGTDSWATFRRKQGKKTGRSVTTGGQPATRTRVKSVVARAAPKKAKKRAKKGAKKAAKKRRKDPLDEFADMFRF